MDEKTPEIQNSDESRIAGIVTARKCGCCGHHEIGIATDTGKYISLKPGMKIIIIGGRFD